MSYFKLHGIELSDTNEPPNYHFVNRDIRACSAHSAMAKVSKEYKRAYLLLTTEVEDPITEQRFHQLEEVIVKGNKKEKKHLEDLAYRLKIA